MTWRSPADLPVGRESAGLGLGTDWVIGAAGRDPAQLATSPQMSN